MCISVSIVIASTPVGLPRQSSPFLLHFLLSFTVASCYNPFEIQFMPSLFPARKARDA
ncbi:hypothetical protein SBA5_580006 [Candidatus Sulfotelmatomonas gaucii]|uniref:Uncharacterized protein n=1 Tax=Candidatus Sulfuritelmatomonas gaucii TaxID=2043161 RepID=A0A2N9LV72_9BACT|nr:hypothetical protein SBA5_580006 [Candidatus Sulfotelmatomonas gaucii]